MPLTRLVIKATVFARTQISGRNLVMAVMAHGERRHLTVLFCDLVDSTPLAERLDQEELAEVYAIWQDACAEAIAEHGGHISDYRGDSVLVFFGYPAAFEDSPHRAIRTALGIIERLAQVNARLLRLYKTTLAVRIGIHAGLVLLSDLGGRFARDQFALGETPNIAARLQALAGPNQIFTSGAVRNLVRGYFSFEEIGEYTLKGVSRAVAACRVVAGTDALDRIQAAGEKGLTPFVGREAEMAALRQGWTMSSAGHGQAIMLIGEAGIGKSRLVDAITGIALGEGAQRLILRCSPYHSASALYPAIEHMRRFLGIESGEGASQSLERLERAVALTGSPDPARDAELLAALMELPLEETPLMRALNPQQRRARGLDALVAWTTGSAQRQPLLMIVEDIQWADPSTIEFLALLMAAMDKAPLAMVLTTRPEKRALFDGQPSLLRLPIGRLGDADSRELMDNALKDAAVAPDLRAQIVARADGVPLFLEELVAMIAEAAPAGRAAAARGSALPPTLILIPLTLEDLLAARLDRQQDCRETAQLAAALGREFSLAMISAASGPDTAALRVALDKLIESDLIQQAGDGDNPVFRFKHALVRDAAYQSMLKGRRQKYHRAIAVALEKGISGSAASPPEILAYHFTEAGAGAQAIPYWLEAGQRAVRRSASIEALHHLDRGIDLLEGDEPGPARDREELALQLVRGTALLMLKGQSSSEMHACFERARELSQGLADSPELFTALFGLCRTHLIRGSLAPARIIAEQLTGIAGRLNDPALELASNTMLSLVLYHLCELPKAAALAHAGILQFSALTPQSRQSPIFNLGQHPAVACCFCASFIAMLRGEPDISWTHQQQGMVFARETGTAFQLANSEGWSMMLAILRRDTEAALEAADRVLAISREHVFPQWEFTGSFHRGILLVEQGQHEEGLALALAGVAAGDTLGSQNTRVRVRALYAQACGLAGRISEGLDFIREAHASLNLHGEQWWGPELHRIEGHLHLAGGERAAIAERCFRAARALAQTHGLRLFELRAAASLARLLRDGGRMDEGRAALAPVLAEFPASASLRDLAEARALFIRITA